MPAETWEIIIEENSDFTWTLEFQNDDGTPMDLTGYEPEFILKESEKSENPLHTLTTTPNNDGSVVVAAENGTVDITLLKATVNTLKFVTGYFIFKWTAGGITDRVIQGPAKYSKE